MRTTFLDEEDAKEVPALVSMNDLLKRTQAEVKAQATLSTSNMVHQAIKADRIIARAVRMPNEPTAPAREEPNAA